MFLLGAYTLPNFKASYIDAFAKGALKFTFSATVTIVDVVLIIKIIKCIIYNQNIPLYLFVIVAIITFLLFRYYIDISYKVVSRIINEITEKKYAIQKAIKLILSLITFLTALVPLANCICDYLKILP